MLSALSHPNYSLTLAREKPVSWANKQEIELQQAPISSTAPTLAYVLVQPGKGEVTTLYDTTRPLGGVLLMD